jgi:hypothetical protein
MFMIPCADPKKLMETAFLGERQRGAYSLVFIQGPDGLAGFGKDKSSRKISKQEAVII